MARCTPLVIAFASSRLRRMRSSDCRRSMSAISAVVVPPASSSMISWIRIFIKPPCVPVDCRQCLESLINRAPARLSESSVGENVARFGPKSLVVQVVVQQFLNLMERPVRATALHPVALGRSAIELFIGRISPRRETAEPYVHGHQAARFHPARQPPRDE